MKKKLLLLVNIILLFLLIFSGCNKLETTPTITPDSRIVCLFFDDGYQNQYDVVYPILNKYNFKATFSIITSVIGTGTGLYQYMSLDELKDLANNGMDIGSHSITHAHLLTIPDSQLHDEIFNSKEQLESMGLVINTFVTPFYEWDDKVLDYIIAANYTCARGGGPVDNVTFDPYDPNPRARYHAAPMQISNQTLTKFKSIVNKTGPHAAVCLVYHFVSDDGPSGTSTTLDMFKKQMSYLQSANFTVVTLPELYKKIN